MEHFNVERQPLSELIKEAEEKKLKIIIVHEPIIDGHHRAKAFIESDKFMVIGSSNLLPEDLEKINLAENRNSAFERPPIPFTNHRELPEVNIDTLLREAKTQWYEKFPKKLNKKSYRKK